jgi:chromosome segregation protein
MHLRSLRLRGFKSFPDALELSLEPGVAVVVGPNGSGKSNVADAIVWAAGSLAPSELRAERPDDVLFAGGGDRKPAEHCEVELLFDNADGGFGSELDFSEVSIMRRLVRGGEGSYLVNRAAVRRTDLVELLADVGLGGTMHSIVSQGKVDAVLASKPGDRRELVEEAAGLGKFKRRKHRAELKLARVATQVDRARDVEDEVRKRLRPLALQATAAERAEKLAVEIGRLQARIAQLDLEAIEERRATAEERRTAAALVRRSTQERLTALLQERQGIEDELSDAAGKREAAVSALYRLQGVAERIALRREAAEGLDERLGEELAAHARVLQTAGDETVRALQTEAARLAAAAREAAQASGSAAERARLVQARLAAIERASADSAERRLDDVRRAREDVERALADVSAPGRGARSSLPDLAGTRERLAHRLETLVLLRRSLVSDIAEARTLDARGGLSPGELERLANEAAGAARVAATERDDLAERARATRDRVLALERAIGEYEGLPPAARALAEQGERIALASLEIDPGSERAVAAALGRVGSALLAVDPRAGLTLLERARQEGLGSLTVLAGRNPQDVVDALPVVPLDRLLDVRASSVTDEGFGFDPDRGELWFAGDTAEAVLLEMDARRRALDDEANELSARAEAAARAAGEAAARAADTEAAYAAVAHLRERTLDTSLLVRLQDVTATLETGLGRAAGLAGEIEAALSARLAAGAERAVELGNEMRRLADAEAEARRAHGAATAAAQTAEVTLARLGAAGQPGSAAAPDEFQRLDRESLVHEAAAALAEAEAAAAAALAAADRSYAADAALAGRVPKRPAVDADLLERLQRVTASLRAALDRTAQLTDRLQTPVRARADAGAQRSSELGAELRRLGASEVELRQAAELAAERATEVEVGLARIAAEAEEAQRRLEAVGTDDVADGDNRAELADRVARLEARREALGRVNPLAKEEYEAEKERLDELTTQRTDLESSLEEVAKLRDELAETVRRRFDETFAAVAANFEDVAGTLFPGGEGRLCLLPDEDGGEEGIEVELRPAGKRITRLSLLSGGEKALGAISFLFALFLAKPCPFYLLDEVEAALDDTNIARFVELLRRYSDRAQFVVITHQKRTMEAADVLYGVTMGKDGVSEIVSRRLPRHEQPALAASS